MFTREIIVKSESEMEAVGAEILNMCGARAVIYLHGELGAGKTTLVRGLLRALGYRGAAKSPTYTLVEPYILGDKKIYHFDLYRVVDAEELEYIGIRDYFAESAISLIEWPEQAKGLLPKPDITVHIEVVDATTRRLSLSVNA